MNTARLFNSRSTSHTSPIFRVSEEYDQITLIAYGLIKGESITIETRLYQEDPARATAKGCLITANESAALQAAEPLLVSCDPHKTSVVTLTYRNNIVILDAPQDVPLVAKYEFEGQDRLGQFTLEVIFGTKTKTIAPQFIGCPPVDKYYPSFPLPCFGLAYDMDIDIVDPEATKTHEIGCDSKLGAIALYPKPTEVARIKVTSCSGDLLGFAVSATTGGENCEGGDHQLCRIAYESKWEEVKYLGTFALPCGGTAYSIHDVVDPKATVEIQNCKGAPIAYVYPTHEEGVTTPIENCRGDILGYAMDRNMSDCDHQLCRIDYESKWEEVKYLGTFALPCGGTAYTVHDIVDPKATVEIQNCNGAPIAYVYPTHDEGVTTPIENCRGDVLGFAMDRNMSDCDHQLCRISYNTNWADCIIKYNTFF